MPLKLLNSRLEPLSGRIASVGELVPESHRTTRAEVGTRDDSVMSDESRVNKRVKTTIEDWENEQVRRGFSPLRVSIYWKLLITVRL